MRKFKLLLAAMLVGAMSLTGCHGGKRTAAFEIPDTFDEGKNYEITFWAKNDTNKTQVNIYEKTIKDFESIYPNIDVTLKTYTDYNTIYNDVITNISTNTTPNVCITYPDHIATYITGENVVVPLDDLMMDSEYGLGGSKVKFDSVGFDEIVPQFLEEGIIGNQHYALPFMRSTEACYINKTYVEKLGYEIPENLTWDFVWEVSEAAVDSLDEKTGIYAVNGQNVMIPFIYKSTDNMLITMLRQLDAGYSDASGNIEIFNEDTKEIMREVYFHGKTKAFSTFKISSYPGNFLNAGQCLFAIDSTAGATWMGSDAPLGDIAKENIVDFETIAKMIPQYDVNNARMISQGPSVCVFNKEDSGEVLASWLFTQFLLTNDVQIAYSKTEGYVPVTLKAKESSEYMDYLSREGEDNNEHYYVKIEAAKLLLDNTDKTFVTPVFNGSASLRNAAGQLIEDSVKAARRKQDMTSEEAIEAEFKNITSLYRLDQRSAQGNTEGKAALGKLPAASVALIVTLIIVWIFILIYVIFSRIRAKNRA